MREASIERGINPENAQLIHHYSNAIFHIPSANLIARLTAGASAGQRLRQSQRIVEWLVTTQTFPATAPAALEPIEITAGVTVTFWRYYPQPTPAPPLTSEHLGRLLEQLHAIEGTPPAGLRDWVPLAALDEALADPSLTHALSADECRWLHSQIDRTREECDQLDWRLGRGIIHGDAWAGNLLWNTNRRDQPVVLADWDWVSHGPREADLVPTWHADRRYGRGTQWSEAFIHYYGYDLATWSGFETLMRMRDLAQLSGPLRRAADNSREHQIALRQRLDGIREGRSTEVWRAL